METTNSCLVNSLTPFDSNIIPKGSFRIAASPKKSRTIEFFDELYNYPPSFRVKWDGIDELHDDLVMSYNYRAQNKGFPFSESGAVLDGGEDVKSVKKTKYPLKAYVRGYFNKLTSTNFYANKAKRLQDPLKTVPIYTILNGQGEIVLATSTDATNSGLSPANKSVYDLCGNFDSLVERDTQLGLFFMSKHDAEVYLQEIAKTDTQGTKMFGLSIHCFGLDFAYRVMREYHPNVDFRFVPNLNEVQSLMTPQNTGSANVIFDEGQQQLRFRRRPIPIFPISATLNKWFSPFSSFVSKTEYFKGVPIYVVNVHAVPRNYFVQQYHNTVNLLDNVYGRVFNYLSTGFGFGSNWIMEGSLQKQSVGPELKTYVFFEQKAASEFCNSYAKRISRYTGSRAKIFESFIKKPKIFVHNLEDFLELCEETLLEQATSTAEGQNSVFDAKKLNFIPASQSTVDVNTYFDQTHKSPVKRVFQFIDFKYRRLTGFMEVLLNTN